MKKTLLITVIAVAAGLSAVAQNVNIPDPVFKNYLLNNPAINTNGDDEIQESEAAAFTGTIYYDGGPESWSLIKIHDLTGIEAFTALTRLEVPNNYIDTLDLSANTALNYLDWSNNRNWWGDVPGEYNMYFSSLDVSNSALLDTLICSGNALTSLDLSVNTALVYLDCSDNANILDFYFYGDGLGGVDDYYTFHYDPTLESINLNGLTSLAYVNCSGNRLQTLDVSTNTALTYLDCSGNFSVYEYENYYYVDIYYETPYLVALYMRNGNNTLLEGQNFNATQNAVLGCIEVDDAVYAQSVWSGSVDATASFSEDCPAYEDIAVSVETANNVPAAITTDMGTLQMVAIVTPEVFTQQVTWSIVPVSGSAYISENGLVQAYENATVYAKATSVINPEKSDSMLITITNQLSISIATENNVPAEITTDQGTLQMMATVLPADTNQLVIWSIVNLSYYDGDAYVSEDGLITALEDGIVYVKVQSILNPARCDSMEVYISNQTPNSINSPESANQLFPLYPNPNNGRFIIEGPASGRGSYNLSISNVLGQKVFSQTVQVNGDKLRVEIAAGELVPGIYFLNIAKEGKRVAVKQFVIN